MTCAWEQRLGRPDPSRALEPAGNAEAPGLLPPLAAPGWAHLAAGTGWTGRSARGSGVCR